MSWQDLILTGGSLIFSIALLPAVFGKDKPPVSTSLITGIILSAYVVVYLSFSLFTTGILTALLAFIWLVLAYQKFASSKERNPK